MRISFLRSASVLAGVTLLTLPTAADAQVLDFEEFTPPATPPAFAALNLGPTFTSQGFRFTAVGSTSPSSLLIAHDGQPNIPNSGSNTFAQGSQTQALDIVRSDGGAFTLFSFLGAEGRNTNTGFFQFSATSIRLDGTIMGGGTISTTFMFDLIAMENAVTDFQTFNPSGFTNLSSLRITGLGGASGNSFTLDNVNFSGNAAIPEPGTLALLLIGGMTTGAGFVRRRRA